MHMHWTYSLSVNNTIVNHFNNNNNSNSALLITTEVHGKLTQQHVKLFPVNKNWNLHLPCDQSGNQ